MQKVCRNGRGESHTSRAYSGAKRQSFAVGGRDVATHLCVCVRVWRYHSTKRTELSPPASAEPAPTSWGRPCSAGRCRNASHAQKLNPPRPLPPRAGADVVLR